MYIYKHGYIDISYWPMKKMNTGILIPSSSSASTTGCDLRMLLQTMTPFEKTILFM